jgi:hypothetical protein
MRYEGDERTGWKDNVNEGGIKEYSFQLIIYFNHIIGNG